MGAEVWQILHRIVFAGFWELTNTRALMTKRRLKNLHKITLYGIYHSSAPINATQVPKVHLKLICPEIVKYKMHVLNKCLIEALDDIKVHNEVL